MPAPRRSATAFADLILAVVVLLAALPILWMVVLSVQPNRNIISPRWDFSFSLQNLGAIFAPQEPFSAELVNSLLIVAGTVGLCLIIGSLAGYSVSRLRWSRAGAYALLGFAGFLPLVPPMTLVPGLYVTLNTLGLLGTVLGLIMLNTVFNIPFATLMMKVYFDAVPGELREAALVDGASEARVFGAVMLPVVAPGLAAVAVFTGIMAWNEFLMGLTMTSGGRSAPVTVGIASLVQPYQITWGEMAAAGTLAALPIILLTLLANRQIVAGLTSGAVKG